MIGGVYALLPDWGMSGFAVATNTVALSNFQAGFGLLRDHESRLCERSEAILSFNRGVLRLLHFVRNEETQVFGSAPPRPLTSSLRAQRSNLVIAASIRLHPKTHAKFEQSKALL